MHNTTPPKSKEIVVKGTVRKAATGHTPHRGGGGAHRHKNDRRQGNRSQQTNRAVSEY